MNASADCWDISHAMLKVKLPKGVKWMSMARCEDAMIGILRAVGHEIEYQQVLISHPYEAESKVKQACAAFTGQYVIG